MEEEELSVFEVILTADVTGASENEDNNRERQSTGMTA